MKVGISLTATANGVHSHDSIDYCRWAARFADEAGFDVVWTTEHHFTAIAHTGAPSAALAYYAGVTERVRLGYAVAIVPLHHPLRLAEEFLWVDNLSDGRLIGGISPGWAAYEFELFGVPLEERRDRLAEAWEIIRRACAGEPVQFSGKYFHVPELVIYPPPRQAGGIPFILSTGHVESVRQAAKWRVSPVFGAPPVPVIVDLLAAYDAACREEGYSDAEIATLHEWVGVRRFVTIGRTEDEAREEALIHSARLQSSLDFLSTTRGSERQGDPRNPRTLANDVWGTVERVTEQLLELERIGMRHFICNFTIGSRGLEGTKETIRLFAREILPVLQASERRAAATVAS
ncbi:MAG: LLM class flavin-dependent oxidoreductase [Chloroflexota bacterium]|nr:LLM class flavin-dependent oxidoreductase [Dehalococcoidia bacterium]MDW8252918.1 LLM class flavin-dependent oxidoreductase [Chloroflexota bacterium]